MRGRGFAPDGDAEGVEDFSHFDFFFFLLPPRSAGLLACLLSCWLVGCYLSTSRYPVILSLSLSLYLIKDIQYLPPESQFKPASQQKP